MPDVSAIITCFNLERYVGAAIESALAQAYEGEIEIIVVDDCSTDGSAEVIQSFERVRYIRTARNSGVLLAMLAGIEAASADVLLFLDGDDLWEPGKVAAVADRFARDGDIAFVTHDLSYIDSASRALARTSRPKIAMAEIAAGEVSQTLRDGILGLGDFIWLGSAFAVRRSRGGVEDFATWARSLPDPANTYQDWPLAYWVAARPGIKLDYVPAKLFRYRLHEFNHSGDARTPERMLRNLRRARNTNAAMLDIARQTNVPEECAALVERRVRFSDYLITLYEGRRLAAAKTFLRSASDLRRRKVLTKELVRFCAIELLGPARFARLASRRKVLRDLPTT